MNLFPDIDLGRRFLEENPPPGRVLMCAVTGSHHYGFPSPDSDLDLKGIYALPTEHLLGLSPTTPTHDRLEFFEGTECDLTCNEVSRALGLVLRGNGNLLERLFSPFQLTEDDTLQELRVLARGALSRSVARHYRGYFEGMCREHTREPTAKALLYTYRVALTGIHLLRTGEVLADLPVLSEMYDLPRLTPLIAHKREGAERCAPPADLDAHLRAGWPDMAARLEAARESSPLPEEAPNTAACERWLIALRRQDLRVE